MTSNSTARTAAGVIAALVLVAGILVNLPFLHSQHGGTWVKLTETTDPLTRVDDSRSLVHAGWPFRYLTRHQTSDDLPAVTRHWSAASLAMNAVVFVIAAIIAFTFVVRRRRKIQSATKPARVQLRFDIAAAIALIAIPCVAVMVAFVESRRHMRLASALSLQGSCYLASSMPSFLAPRMPQPLVDCFSKIRAAEIFVPNDQQVEALLSLDSLVGCSLYTSQDEEASFDSSLLQAVEGHPQLAYLALRNLKVNDQVMEWISGIPYLLELSLNNNSVTDKHLRSLAELNQLSALRMIGNPCRFVSIPDNSAWLATIRSLELSCPPTGVEDSLTLQDCPRLERLELFRRRLEDNPAEFALTVSGCPLLSSLTLDRVQKYALRLRNLPRLTNFGQDMSMTAMYLPATTTFPGAFWASLLELESLPNLTRLRCLSTDLQSISLRDVPNIRSFSLGSFRRHGGGSTSKIDVAPERVEHLLDEIGRLQELESLRLELCSLREVDVSKFAQNRSLRNLHLAATDISVEQAKQLTAMKQLTDLQLGECSLSSDDVDDFLSELPNLRSLGCNVFDVDDLHIEDNPQLERLLITAVNSPRSIRIQNAPQLKTSLYLLSAPQELTIVGSPGLLDLVVDGQWPKSSTLRDLRMLRCFAAGGPELDDQVVSELRYCTQLDELTLAYANLGPTALRTIRQFQKLTTLQLPSAPVDDSVVDSWRAIRRLQHVNLDETNIDVGTIRWAKNLPNLKSFSINDVPLSDEACTQVAQLGNIQRLGLAHTNVNKPQIQRLLIPGRVSDLTLGGLEIDDELIDAMAANESLVRLVVEPTDLGMERLKTLLQRCPELVVQFRRPHRALLPELQDELDQRVQLRERTKLGSASNLHLPNSNDATLEHVSAETRTAIESTVRIRQTPGKLDLKRLRRSMVRRSSNRTNDPSVQNGASSSSTASDKAALASSTAAPVTPP